MYCNREFTRNHFPEGVDPSWKKLQEIFLMKIYAEFGAQSQITFQTKDLDKSGDIIVRNLQYVYETEDIIDQETFPINLSNCYNECINNVPQLRLQLNRPVAFQRVISDAVMSKEHYGIHSLEYVNSYNLICGYDSRPQDSLNLSELRACLAKDVATRIIQYTDPTVPDRYTILSDINFSLRAKEAYGVYCGPVHTADGNKNFKTTAAELYGSRANQMELIAMHRLGIRNQHPLWYKQLGHAAVTFDLLETRLGKPVKINTENLNHGSSKGAAFVLYNYARITQLLQKWNTGVTASRYPHVILNNVDYKTLTEPEEWEILFVYIYKFPMVIKDCVMDIQKGHCKIHLLCNFLSKLCLLFSVYYQRIKIFKFANNRRHLPQLIARIHLLKAIWQVLHNGLTILNISPVTAM